MKRRFAQAAAFIIASVLIISGIYGVISYKATGGGGGFRNYYGLGKNTVDVLFIGSSHAHCSVNNAQLWNEKGISSFTLSSANQSIDTTWYFLKEAFKTQHPKMVFAETFNFNRSDETEELTDEELTNVYRADLLTKFSTDTFGRVLSQQKDYGFDDNLRNELLLRFPIIHTRYEELTAEDFSNETSYKKGYQGSFETGQMRDPEANDEIIMPDEKCTGYIDKITKLCKEEGAELILFCAPGGANTEEYSRQNGIKAYAESCGIKFINMNSPEFMDRIDTSTDFRFDEHLNNSGAAKVTAYIEELIDENGTCADHRGDKAYSSWDKDALYVRDRFLVGSLLNAETLGDYIAALSEDKDRLDVIVSFSGNHAAMGEEGKAVFTGLGIDSDSFDRGGTYKVSGGVITDVVTPESDVSTIKLGKKDCRIKYHEDEEKQIITADISLDLVNYGAFVNGATVLLYDPEIDAVVDCIYMDFFESGLQLLRHEGMDLITY